MTVGLERASFEDAGEILTLQRAAYRSEAALYGDDIAPMVETLEEIKASFGRLAFLKAVSEGEIIGSVRASQGGETCFIGRLIVAPEHQGRGIGTRLMREVELLFPSSRSFELFTGKRSEGNLRLYRSLGYESVREERVGDAPTFVYLAKSREREQDPRITYDQPSPSRVIRKF